MKGSSGRTFGRAAFARNNSTSSTNDMEGACGESLRMGMGSHALQERISTVCNSSSSGDGSRVPPQRQPPYYRQTRGGGQSASSSATYRDEHRYWSHSRVPPPPPSGRFTVVSYNILGVDNANQHWRELYSHIPPYIMDWEWRKGRILQELGLWSPDVLCLQEVDRFEDLQKAFVSQGYEGIYKGRTGGSTDGCALFWRAQKFCLLQEESIEFQELEMRHNVAQLCVLQVNHNRQEQGKRKMSNTTEKKNIVVCNIHVLFNPNRGDIKLGQVRHLLKKAYSLSQEWGGIPVIIAGDFNSIPQSPLYQYIQRSKLDISHFDRRRISGQVEGPLHTRTSSIDRWTSSSLMIRQEEEVHVNALTGSVGWRHEKVRYESTLQEGQQEWREANTSETSSHLGDSFERSRRSHQWNQEELKLATGDPVETLVSHNFRLQSAYAAVRGPAETRDPIGEPLVTTYHGRFMGTVDYIWFSEGLMPLKVLDVLPVQVLKKTKGLPSKKWGSDHMALACEFALPSSEGR